MNCNQVQQRLVDLAFGELGPEEARRIESHLATCETCRGEWEPLAASCELVDHAARQSPQLSSVNVPRLFAEAHRRTAQRARRWRMAAWSAVAAAVLVAAASLGELIRVERQVANEPQPDPRIEQLQAELAESQAALAAQRRRMDEFNRLAALIVEELEARDARAVRTSSALHLRIEDVRLQNDRRWKAVGRGFHDWYLAQHLDASPDEPITSNPLQSGVSP